MWGIVITRHLPSWLLGNTFTFQSSLKQLDQLEPSLVWIFIGWLYKSYVTPDWKSTTETRGPIGQKGCFLFLFVDHLFFNQLWWICFVMYLINFYLCSMPPDVLWLLPLPRYKGVKIGSKPINLYYYIQSTFEKCYCLDS